MTGSGTILRGGRGARTGWIPLVAGLCLVLLAFLAVAQVAHLHTDQADADHCQLCIVMHTVVPVAAAAAIVVIVQLGASAPQPEPVFVARRFHSSVFIRPPPASC
ncbi:MAG: hypothetical protein ACLQG3_03610 [Terracidiphilus sp.]